MKFRLIIEADSIEELKDYLPQQDPRKKPNKDLVPITPPKKEPIRKGKEWTTFELNFIKEHYLKFSYATIGKKLQRKAHEINYMVQKMVEEGLPPKYNKPINKI